MNLSNVVIVLDHPDESRNIGAACRAMANNDISILRIVGNKSDYDIEHIHVLAIHAGYIFDKAEFFPSIKEATKDCALCAGTTRRIGKKRGKLFLPEEFAKKISSLTGVQNNQQDVEFSGAKVAVVFGNERTGLTDEQLEECNLAVTIPSSQGFGSLNLSHAVQIMCYHLFRKNMEEKNRIIAGVKPITLERLDKSVKIISNSLEEVGFFKMPGREDMEKFWRNILSRAMLTEGEAKYLEKVFVKIYGLSKKNSKKED